MTYTVQPKDVFSSPLTVSPDTPLPLPPYVPQAPFNVDSLDDAVSAARRLIGEKWVVDVLVWDENGNAVQWQEQET